MCNRACASVIPVVRFGISQIVRISAHVVNPQPVIAGRALRPQSLCLISFGLRSVSGESGAKDGEKRLAKRSRSATARRRAADGSVPQSWHSGECPLVTSARICEVERASSKGNRATGSPCSAANRALVTAHSTFLRLAVDEDGFVFQAAVKFVNQGHNLPNNGVSSLAELHEHPLVLLIGK